MPHLSELSGGQVVKEIPETGRPLPTDLGEGRRKRARPEFAGLKRIDVKHRDQVFDLAEQLVLAEAALAKYPGHLRRRLMQVNLEELLAIARLAVWAAPTMTQAIALIEADEAGVARPDCAVALANLIATAKDSMEEMP